MERNAVTDPVYKRIMVLIWNKLTVYSKSIVSIKID